MKLKSIILGITATFLFSCQQNLKKETPNMRTWFKSEDCQSFEIIKYKSISDHAVAKKNHVKDAGLAKKIMNNIKALPVEGEKMKSFGPEASHIDVVFHCGQTQEVVAIYEGHFKTPATSFLSKNEAEDQIIKEIMQLLNLK